MTPQPPPQHIQIELARRELRALKQQQVIAEQGIESLSAVSAQLSDVTQQSSTRTEWAIVSALVALVAVRLLELQTAHGNLPTRISELEHALGSSGLVIPRRHN